MKSTEIYNKAKADLLDVIVNALYKQTEKTGKSVIKFKDKGIFTQEHHCHNDCWDGYIRQVMFAKDADNITPYGTTHPYDVVISEDGLYDSDINEVDLTILFQIAKECERITE